MHRTFQFGNVAYSGTIRRYAVDIEMELDCSNTDKPVFSVSANVWNVSHTDIVMGGQCLDSIWSEFKHQINNPTLFKKIMGLWQRNHLNDMNAGCEHQQALNWHNDKIGVPCPICGYSYGSKWLYRAISDNDLQEIKNLLSINEKVR